MILVTLGTHRRPFPRLAQWMDRWAAAHDEEVQIQLGFTSEPVHHATAFDFASPERMAELSRQARVVVGHAGVGTILAALQEGTPFIVVPRIPDNDEHLDGHQVDLARHLEAQGRVRVAWNESDLADAIADPSSGGALSEEPTLARFIKGRLDALHPRGAFE